MGPCHLTPTVRPLLSWTGQVLQLIFCCLENCHQGSLWLGPVLIPGPHRQTHIVCCIFLLPTPSVSLMIVSWGPWKPWERLNSFVHLFACCVPWTGWLLEKWWKRFLPSRIHYFIARKMEGTAIMGYISAERETETHTPAQPQEPGWWLPPTSNKLGIVWK